MAPKPSAAVLPSVDPALWGKLGKGPGRPYPLIQHSLDTSASAYAVWDLWLRSGLRQLLTDALAPGQPGKARSMFAALAGLHDIGKINVIFQGQLGTEDTDWYRHDFIPAHLDDLKARGYNTDHPKTLGYLGAKNLDLFGSAGSAARRHEAITLLVVAGVWPGKLDKVSDNWAAAVLGAHHGRYHPNDESFDQEFSKKNVGIDKILAQFTSGMWGEQQQAHIRAVTEACGITIDDLRTPLHSKTAESVILLSGIVSLADWIASTKQSLVTGRNTRVDAVTDPHAYLQTRTQNFPDILRATLGKYEPINDVLTDVMGENKDSLSSLQCEALTVGRGLWVATVPAGDGKTEAALLRHSTFSDEGLLFALPTRATTDAMWLRVRNTYHRTPNFAALLHQHSQLNSFYADRPDATPVSTDGCGDHEHGLTPNDWLTGSSTALLAPLSVSTCDQVLLGALATRRSYMRLTAIANRHVVLDEVHTYDTYQATLLEELLAWCGTTDTRVTLLSASLPTYRLQRYTEAYAGTAPEAAIYPGTTTATADGEVTQQSVTSRREFTLGYRLHEVRGDELVDEHVRLVRKYRAASKNARIAVVVNQVDRAIAIGRELSDRGENVIVFHSRKTAFHRKDINERLTEMLGKGSIFGGITVVGTQVIEASLDVDFDCMITDLAPAASLIQRAGRLWRHSEPFAGGWTHRRPRKGENPMLDIVVALDETYETDGISPIARYPYLMAELKRTKAALEARDNTIQIPADVQQLVDQSSITNDDADVEIELILQDILDEYYADLQRLRKAANVVISFRGRGHTRAVLHPDVAFSTLSGTTTNHELDEAATRYIDQDQKTYLFIDPECEHKWAWHGTAEDAMNVTGDAARDLLGYTFTLTDRKREQMGEDLIDLTPAAGWNPRSAVFRDVIPLTVKKSYMYNGLLGLSGTPRGNWGKKKDNS